MVSDDKKLVVRLKGCLGNMGFWDDKGEQVAGTQKPGVLGDTIDLVVLETTIESLNT